MAGWLGGWVAGWVAGWLGGWLAGRLGSWLDGWLGGSVAGLLAGWLRGVAYVGNSSGLLHVHEERVHEEQGVRSEKQETRRLARELSEEQGAIDRGHGQFI